MTTPKSNNIRFIRFSISLTYCGTVAAADCFSPRRECGGSRRCPGCASNFCEPSALKGFSYGAVVKWNRITSVPPFLSISMVMPSAVMMPASI